MSLVRLEGVVREIGTFVILDRIDAAIAPGERIGLVGPNGAGKTTLLRIASGRDEPDRGTVTRRRGLSVGLLGQEAHFDATFMASPDLRDGGPPRRGAPRDDGRRARPPGARGPRGGHRLRRPPAPVRRPRRLHAGPAGRRGAVGARLRARRVAAAADGALRRPADARGAGAPGDRGPGPAAARRAHEPPRHRRDRVARGAPPPADGRAPRRLARPGVPRRDRPPRVGAPRPAPDRVPRRLQRLPPPAGGARRARGEGGGVARRPGPARGRARPALPEPAQAREDARARGPAREAQGGDAGRAEEVRRGPSGSTGRRSPAGRCGRARSSSGSRTSPSGTCRGAAPSRPTGRMPPSRSSSPARRSSPRSAGSGSGSSGRTAPARRRCCGRSPATCRRSTASSRSATRSSPGTSPSCATRRSPARRCSTPSSRRSRSRPARPAATSRASCSAATTPSRRSGRCPAASGRGWSSRCSGSCRRTCCCSTSRRTTWTSRPARRSRRSWPRSPATLLLVSHDRRLLETICDRLWVVDDALAVPFDGGYRAWRQAVADGWTVAGRGGPPREPRPAGHRAARAGVGADREPRRVAEAGDRVRGVGRRHGSASSVAAAPPGEAREALEGRLPAAQRGPGRRAVAPRPAQVAARARDGRRRPSPPTSSSCAA